MTPKEIIGPRVYYHPVLKRICTDFDFCDLAEITPASLIGRRVGKDVSEEEFNRIKEELSLWIADAINEKLERS